MTENPISGTLVFLLGGIAATTYLLPFRGVKGWAYETGWLVSVLAGWLVFSLVFDAIVVPDFWNVLGAASASTLFRSFGFGVLWGVGALCWALMVRYLGVGLGLAIGAGLCAATGTLPMTASRMMPPPTPTQQARTVTPKMSRCFLTPLTAPVTAKTHVPARSRICMTAGSILPPGISDPDNRPPAGSVCKY